MASVRKIEVRSGTVMAGAKWFGSMILNPAYNAEIMNNGASDRRLWRVDYFFELVEAVVKLVEIDVCCGGKCMLVRSFRMTGDENRKFGIEFPLDANSNFRNVCKWPMGWYMS